MAAVARPAIDVADRPRPRVVPAHPPEQVLFQADDDVVGPQVVHGQLVVRARGQRIEGEHQQRLPQPGPPVTGRSRERHHELVLIHLVPAGAHEAAGNGRTAVVERRYDRRQAAVQAAVVEIAPPEELGGEKEGAKIIQRADPGRAVHGEHDDRPAGRIEKVAVRVEPRGGTRSQADGNAGRVCRLHPENGLRVVFLGIVGRDADHVGARIDGLGDAVQRVAAHRRQIRPDFDSGIRGEAVEIIEAEVHAAPDRLEARAGLSVLELLARLVVEHGGVQAVQRVADPRRIGDREAAVADERPGAPRVRAELVGLEIPRNPDRLDERLLQRTEFSDVVDSARHP